MLAHQKIPKVKRVQKKEPHKKPHHLHINLNSIALRSSLKLTSQTKTQGQQRRGAGQSQPTRGASSLRVGGQEHQQLHKKEEEPARPWREEGEGSNETQPMKQ